jgi:hypothetical protein
MCLGSGLMLALLGRGPLGPVFLGLGLGALALGVALRESSWFLAAVSIPGSAAGLVGAIVWRTENISYRWLLIVAPLAAGAIFVSRRGGLAQACMAMITAGTVAATFFVIGAFAAFLYGFQG